MNRSENFILVLQRIVQSRSQDFSPPRVGRGPTLGGEKPWEQGWHLFLGSYALCIKTPKSEANLVSMSLRTRTHVTVRLVDWVLVIARSLFFKCRPFCF